MKKIKYKITSGLTGVVLSFILLAVFTGLSIWFYETHNGAIIIARVLVILAATAFALALYRAVFFKVLIHKDGFFFQTAPGNGKYFGFHEIKRMWVSTGRETNANMLSYCNFALNDGKILRFNFTGADLRSVRYMIRRTEAVAAADCNQLENDDQEHIISGKVQGLQRIAVVVFLFVIVLLLTGSLIQAGLPPITYLLPIVLALAAIALEMIQYFSYKIVIQIDGFYCRTNPFNGAYFAYRDISDCKLVEKRKKFGSAFRRGVRKTHYFYFLVFTDSANKQHRILYNKALFQREMNVLIYRFQQTRSKS